MMSGIHERNYQHPVLTGEEEQTLFAIYKAGIEPAATRARDRIVSCNYKLVKSIVAKAPPELPFEDLIQEGMLGLIHAVGKFDPDRGHKLSTYAVWWIRQFIYRAIGKNSRMVRLPEHLRLKLFKRKRLAMQLSLATDPIKRAEIQEQIEALEIPQLDTLENTLSLNWKPDLDADQELLTIISDPDSDPAFAVDRQLNCEYLASLMNLLPHQTQRVLELRYGLAGEDPMTLRKVGETLGLSHERTRQICNVAIKILKAARRTQFQHLEKRV